MQFVNETGKKQKEDIKNSINIVATVFACFDYPKKKKNKQKESMSNSKQKTTKTFVLKK